MLQACQSKDLTRSFITPEHSIVRFAREAKRKRRSVLSSRRALSHPQVPLLLTLRVGDRGAFFWMALLRMGSPDLERPHATSVWIRDASWNFRRRTVGSGL